MLLCAAFWTEGGPSGPYVVVLSERWDIGGASDGHVVLLTERRCCFCEMGYSSSRRRAFFQRGITLRARAFYDTCAT